jgi:peptidoglycan/LPS O-acetylase OafA/YrhL
VTTSDLGYRKDYLATLDGLRACAVLLVLWQHIPNFALPLAVHNWCTTLFGDTFTGTWPLQIDWLRDHVFAAGYLGVDVFFVLSGFLITRILLVDKGRGVPLGHFLVRRMLRIFPIYYLTLVVVWFVEPHPELPWCAFYLSNFYYMTNGGSVMQHSWSLAVEEHFYLLWPIVVYACSSTASRRIAAWGLVPLAMVCAGGLAIGWSDDLRFVGKASQFGTMFRVAPLACGALLAYGETWLRTSPMRTLWLGLTLVLVGTVLRLVCTAELVGSGFAVTRLVSFALASPGLVMACIAASERRGVVGWWLRSPPMRFIGRISYGLYLYHNVVYHWTGLYASPGDLQTLPVTQMIATAVGVTFVLATVSFYVIERPCLKFAARFRRE